MPATTAAGTAACFAQLRDCQVVELGRDADDARGGSAPYHGIRTLIETRSLLTLFDSAINALASA